MTGKTEKRVTSGDIQDLAVAVEQLTEETRLLRMSLDEIRDDVVWATRQILAADYQISGTPPPGPRDPLAPDTHLAESRTPLHSPPIEHAKAAARETAETGGEPKAKPAGEPEQRQGSLF